MKCPCPLCHFHGTWERLYLSVCMWVVGSKSFQHVVLEKKTRGRSIYLFFLQSFGLRQLCSFSQQKVYASWSSLPFRWATGFITLEYDMFRVYGPVINVIIRFLERRKINKGIEKKMLLPVDTKTFCFFLNFFLFFGTSDI